MDELCNVCGVGFYLPSGRCDHCNSKQEVTTNAIKILKNRYIKGSIWKHILYFWYKFIG